MGVSLVGDRSAKPDDNDNYGDDDGDGEIDEHVHLPFKIPPGRNMSCYEWECWIFQSEDNEVLLDEDGG